MSTPKKLSYSLSLFLLLSILLHLLAWTGFSGIGDSLLLGLDRASHPEVVSFIIADDAPQDKAHPVAAQTETGMSEPAPDPPSARTETLPSASGEADGRAEKAEGQAEERKGDGGQKPAPEAQTAGGAQADPSRQPSPAAPEQNAPPVADTARTAAAGRETVPHILPYTRERLTFSLYWSGINVGTAKLEAVRGDEISSISSEVHSNAIISAFYKVEDHAETRLVKGRPKSFRLIQNEGRHHRNRETIFDTERSKVIYVNHQNQSQQEYDMNGKVLWDIISAFYYLRRQPLEIGKSVYISMFDSKKFLNAEVKILRRATAELEDGRRLPTIVVEPIVNSEGLFQKSGSIVVWLTDDERRLPVRMETQLKIGRVSARLTSFSVVD